MQYVPLGPAPRLKKGEGKGKADGAAFKPPHAGSTGPMSKYEYIPCPAIKQVSNIITSSIVALAHHQ